MTTTWPRRSTICGSAARTVRQTPSMSTSKTRSHSSLPIPRTVATCVWAMPALATTTSRPPKRSTVSATAACIAPLVGDVGADPDRPLADPLGRLARLLGVEVDDRDRGAAHVDLAGGLEADPPGGAGHQRHLSVQVVDGHAARQRTHS